MKQEDEESAQTSVGITNESQGLELEFIKKYEQLPILWEPNHPDYTNKYRRNIALDSLLEIMKKWDSNATRLTVRQKINILRSTYRKTLRKYLASRTIGPDGKEIYEHTPKSSKFYALRFLGGQINVDREYNKSNSILEINLDNVTFEASIYLMFT